MEQICLTCVVLILSLLSVLTRHYAQSMDSMHGCGHGKILTFLHPYPGIDADMKNSVKFTVWGYSSHSSNFM